MAPSRHSRSRTQCLPTMSVEKCASLVAEPSSSNTNNYFVPNRAPAQHASPEPARNTSTPGRATERPEQL
ncbi:hypothetical protein CLOP_g22907 [Closterium sp. NIES-67]|nr:hypothetical protein CLOP_g22907 [Closterium sp. NIES-67]